MFAFLTRFDAKNAQNFNQNPDQSCRPTIGLRALLKRKLIKDFKKIGPILRNLSYNSQCLLFWRDLTQKMPEIVLFDKKKFCQIDVKIFVQPNDPPDSSVWYARNLIPIMAF